MNLFNADLTPEQIDHVNTWVKTLRSGSYKQGKKVLRTRIDAFCCLGVACDLVDPSGWNAITRNSQIYVWEWFNGNTTSLSHKAMDHYGIRTSSGWIALDGETVSLAILNDSGKSFGEIADLIESELALVTK